MILVQHVHQIIPLPLKHLQHPLIHMFWLLLHHNLQLHPPPFPNQVKEALVQHSPPRLQVQHESVGALLSYASTCTRFEKASLEIIPKFPCIIIQLQP